MLFVGYPMLAYIGCRRRTDANTCWVDEITRTLQLIFYNYTIERGGWMKKTSSMTTGSHNKTE